MLRRIISIANNIQRTITLNHQQYELDEMRFFIRKKSYPQWLVYAINKNTKQVANFYIGRRSNKTLNAVVKTLLNAKAEKIYTDRLINYQYLIPKKIHTTKNTEQTESKDKTSILEPHLKRLNRRTIAFSRSCFILSSILKIYFWNRKNPFQIIK
ncbi:IS1 family transposase [Chryseobacterium sp. MMS23-Vi53]|uniref:IS1 family transposase n=1 Tax=Chryseobacterium sp. MMS23-Vi53 TaxID=3386644 RepID=UPI0039EBEF70